MDEEESQPDNEDSTTSTTPAHEPAGGGPSAGPDQTGPAASAGSAPPAAAAEPAVSLVPPPNLATPAKRGGLAGVMDEIADSIAGTKGAGEVYTDPKTGDQYIEHPDLSRKGQWLKIAGEALRGAAAGAAVGQGPGGAARGLQAGIEAGDKSRQQQQRADRQQTQEVRQANQDRANAVLLKHNLAAKEFELGRMKVKAGQDDIKFSQEQNDREEKLGSADLGIVKDEADLADKMGKQAGFWKDVHQNNITAIPEYGEDGTRQGLHIWKRIPGIGNQQTDPGTAIRIWDAGNHKMTTQVPTVPLTHSQVDAYNHAADTQQRQFEIDSNAEDFKKQQMATSEAEEEVHRTQAQKNRTENAGAAPADPKLVEMIGSGQVAPESLNRILGGKDGQKLLEAVAEAHPDLDTAKLAAYPKLHVDFTTGKTGQQRQNLDTAFKAVDDLTKLNTYSARLPAGPARTAWDNRLNAASMEIANGLAKPGTAATEKAIKDTKESLSPVFSRQAAIDKQIDSMMDAYESMRSRWKEAAPSATYESKMPDVGARTKEIMYKHDPGKAGGWFGVPYYDKAGGKLIGFSRDGGKTLEPAQ